MTVFDYTVLGILGFSILIGLMRGAIREIFSVVGWILAFYAARHWNADMLQYMPAQIPGQAIKVIAAFLLVFLVVLFVCSVTSIVLTSFIKAAGLGGLNRLLGGLAGALRGLLLVCVLVMLAGMTDLPKDNRWTSAMLSAPLEMLVLKILPWMPETIRAHVHLGKPAIAVDL